MQAPTPSDHKKILDDVSRISTKLMIGDPSQDIETEAFYGHFFTGLIKVITFQTETLAIAYNKGLITLYINPIFWEERLTNDPYKVGAVKHEILHIVFKHIFRYKGFSNKIIFNIAADLIVNQYVKPDHLIEGAILLDNFPELSLKPHQDLHYYYNALMKFYQDQQKNPDAEDQNESWKNLKSLLNDENPNQKKHYYWKNLEELSSAERDIAEGGVNQALEATLSRIKPKDRGKLPAGLQQYLNEFESSLNPSVNWRRVLRIFSNSSSRTRIRNTLKRPSKRYGSNPGIKVRKKQKLLVAIDSSGSIKTEELQDFFNEVYHIWQQGAEIQIVECDVKIHQSYTYKGQNPSLVLGGGGTSFEAPIEYANLHFRPDALIYLTDGYGPKPGILSNCPILWLISREGAKLEYLQAFQGRKLKMN